VLGVLFPSAIFARRAPEGHVLLTSFVGGMRRPELVTEPPEALERIVREELASLLGVRGTPVFRHEARWTAALPQAVAGHGERLAAAARVEAAEPRIAFAGNWHDGLSVGDAMLGGVRAVDRLATRGGWG
jgi:oxygen-dependent protoporphyrinogen oxidase